MAAKSAGGKNPATGATGAADVKKVLLLIGGKYHAWQSCAEIVKDLLQRSGRYEVTVTEDRSVLAGGLNEYDALALYCQGGEMSSEQEKHICKFVRSGGGLIGLHSANTAFTNSEAFVKLLGSAFDHHPAEHQDVHVKLLDSEHPITVRVGDFLIHDELYVLKNVADDVTVLAETRYQGQSLPVAYTRTEGKGRVFYCSLGHSGKQFRHEQHRKLLLHGADWACGIEPAKKEIGCGLLGYGGAFNMGRTHGGSINSTPGLKTVAACDIDPQRCKTAEEELPGIKTYTSLEKMLADDKVELVVIILPHDQHAEAALKCLRAGKHVVLEKPFCVTLEEADEMIAAADEAGVMLTCYHNRRWDGDYMRIRELIAEGAIGEVFEISCGMAGYKRPGDWWRSDKKLSGGNFYDWGAHFVDWVLGLIPDEIEWVQGFFHKKVWMHVTNEDHTQAMIRFAGGKLADVVISSMSAAPRPRWRILGTRGAILDDRSVEKGCKLYTYRDGQVVVSEVKYPQSRWHEFYNNVADHLVRGDELVVKPAQARRVIGVLASAGESSDSGGSVKPACER